MTTEGKRKWGMGRILLILVVWVVLLVAGGIWALLRYVNSTDFAVDLKNRAYIMTGSYIDFEKVNWDMLKQLTVLKFKMRADKDETPQSAKFTANTLELDYNWKALLRRKLEFTQFTVDSPTVLITQKADGELNLPFVLKGSAPKPADEKAAKQPAPTTSSSTVETSLQVVWPKFDIKNGELTVRRVDGATRLAASGVNINGRCPMDAHSAFAAEGEAQLKQLRLLDLINVSNLKSQYNFKNGILKLTAVEADAYSGKLTGETEEHIGDLQKSFTIKLNCSGANVNQMLKELVNKPDVISGKLEARTMWLGEMGAVEKISGQGNVEIKEGKVINMPIFRKLSAILGNISEIAQPDFSICKMDYTVANQTVDVQSITMKSSMFDLNAKGKVFFNQTLDMDGVMALNPEIMKRIPKEVSSAFKQREDGYTLVDLKITGTLEDPKVEVPLTNVIMNKAADIIQGLLGGKKKEEAPATPPADGQTPAVPATQEQQQSKPLFDLQKLLQKK